MTVPGLYAILLIGLGVYRLCRLAGWDDLTIPLRGHVIGITDEEHSQWTYVMNALQRTGRDPWSYVGPIRRMAPDNLYHPSVRFMVAVGEGTGVTSGHVEMPPLVSERIGTFNEKATPGDHLVPFTRRRWYASKLLRCPWCLGFWITLMTWLAYQAWPHGTLVVMSLFAASAIPGLVTKNLDD